MQVDTMYLNKQVKWLLGMWMADAQLNSKKITIHLAWCTGGCQFTLALKPMIPGC